MKLTAKHVIDTTPETFFDEIFFDRDFNEKLFRDVLEMKGFDIEALEDDGERRRKRIRVTPKQEGPAFVRKAFKGELSYTEDGSWSRGDGVYRYTTTTSVLSERIRISGTVAATPLGDDKCERVIDVSIDVKVPLIGTKLEKFVGDQLRSSFDKGAKFTNEWLADRAASA